MLAIATKEEKAVRPKDKLSDQLLTQFASGDQTLNSHVFGHVPLKLVDFDRPDIRFETPRPDSKKQIYER